MKIARRSGHARDFSRSIVITGDENAATRVFGDSGVRLERPMLAVID